MEAQILLHHLSIKRLKYLSNSTLIKRCICTRGLPKLLWYANSCVYFYVYILAGLYLIDSGQFTTVSRVCRKSSPTSCKTETVSITFYSMLPLEGQCFFIALILGHFKSKGNNFTGLIQLPIQLDVRFLYSSTASHIRPQED